MTVADTNRLPLSEWPDQFETLRVAFNSFTNNYLPLAVAERDFTVEELKISVEGVDTDGNPAAAFISLMAYPGATDALGVVGASSTGKRVNTATSGLKVAGSSGTVATKTPHNVALEDDLGVGASVGRLVPAGSRLALVSTDIQDPRGSASGVSLASTGVVGIIVTMRIRTRRG